MSADHLGNKTINILLLGETGVGKSTFINSFANYIKNNTFEEALNEKPLVVIPTKVTVFDENCKDDRCLTVGSDKNERQETGSSATQNVKVYVFPLEEENFILQLIDTPGIGDTRGPDKDDENCQKILDYLAQLDNLHAICLLIKPSNERNTILFSYCIRRVLSQLHKSACDNIIFIFTNTKGSDYRSGGALPILKKMRDEIANEPPYVNIPINDDNVFCLDNECFKHLLAKDNGVKINQRTLMSCKTSWDVSCEEIIRLIKYVKNLHPHNVKETVSVNQIRDLILQLSKPMSDICQFIQDKILHLQIKEDESKDSDLSIEELEKKLYKPGVDLQIINLENPATVCTNLRCVEPITVGSVTKHRYRNRCCDPCRLGYVTYDVVGHWSLIACEAMTWDFFPTCKRCGCSYKNHMVIYYDTKLIEKQMVDEVVQKNLESEQFQREKLNKLIEKIKKEKMELEDEFNFVSTCAAKFAFFLENNALSSSYDYFKEYIHISLERQRSFGTKANIRVVTKLVEILDRHEELINMLKKNGYLVSGEQINEQTIQQEAEKLFSFKYTGPKLKEIFDARAACIKKEKHDYSLKNTFCKTIPSWFMGR